MPIRSKHDAYLMDSSDDEDKAAARKARRRTAPDATSQWHQTTTTAAASSSSDSQVKVSTHVQPASTAGTAQAPLALDETDDDCTASEASIDDGGKDPAPQVVLWPVGKTRCMYDHRGCTQQNPKHLNEYAHTTEHVRARAKALFWTGPRGALYRLLTHNGVACDACQTQEEQLSALDLVLNTLDGRSVGTRTSVPEEVD